MLRRIITDSVFTGKQVTDQNAYSVFSRRWKAPPSIQPANGNQFVVKGLLRYPLETLAILAKLRQRLGPDELGDYLLFIARPVHAGGERPAVVAALFCGHDSGNIRPASVRLD